MPEPTPGDFFVNVAATEAGLSTDVWYDAYVLFRHEADKVMTFDAYHRERTVCIPSTRGPVDVLVRYQPDPRKALTLRFTAFPAGAEGTSIAQPHHCGCKTRPLLQTIVDLAPFCANSVL